MTDLGSNQQERPKFPKAMKVWTALFFNFGHKRFEVREAIVHDRTPLLIEAFLTVKKVDDTATDDGVQCHQGTLVTIREARPFSAFVGFPELD